MQDRAILVPLLIQVFLTMLTLIRLAIARVTAVRSGSVKMHEIALGQKEAWPTNVQKIDRNYQNQFETPVLFYFAVILALATRQSGHFMVALAWIFVVFRIFHSIEHTSANHVRRRLLFFIGSTVALGLMWMNLAYAWFLAKITI